MGETRSSAAQEDARSSDLSALMDGELTPAQAQAWLDGPGRAPQARADWHAYHLIGDVLRSPELASTAQRDAALLARVRTALAQEPVVLAPAATEAATRGARPLRMRRRLWAGSAAAVAGFLVVGAAYVGTRAGFGDAAPVAVMPVSAPVDDVYRASVGGTSPVRLSATDSPWALNSPVADFREILRLPRGPAEQPQQSVQVLYSNGSATISVLIEPYRAGQHVVKSEQGERLNTLSLQRQDVWLTLSGDVPLGTLHQMAAALQPQR